MLEWKPVESVHFSQSFKMKTRTAAALTNVTLLYIFVGFFSLVVNLFEVPFSQTPFQ